MKSFLTALIFLLPAIPMPATAQANPEFAGYWKTDTEKSSALDPWRRIDMEISVKEP